MKTIDDKFDNDTIKDFISVKPVDNDYDEKVLKSLLVKFEGGLYLRQHRIEDYQLS